jgi:hypothetical protein
MNTTVNILQLHTQYDSGFRKNLIHHKTRKWNARFLRCNFSEELNLATYDTYDSSLLGIDSWVSGLVVPRFAVTLSTNPATLYHPKRPEFSTTLLWKPH